jgi:replicative DNA helicase
MKNNKAELIYQEIINHENKTGKKLSLVIIDHWHLLRFDSKNTTESQNQSVEILNSACKEADTRMMVLCQQDKDSRKNNNRPTMNDTKGSSALADISEVFMALHRPEMDKNYDEELCSIYLDKNRYGRTGKANLKWDRNKLMFTGIDLKTVEIMKHYRKEGGF